MVRLFEFQAGVWKRFLQPRPDFIGRARIRSDAYEITVRDFFGLDHAILKSGASQRGSNLVGSQFLAGGKHHQIATFEIRPEVAFTPNK